jgi:prepilin-type N-terminal cleavage/methylation domain-containing protein
MKMQTRTTAAGYSLVEMLVVVAIIGVLSLVTVPQFMTFYKQNKIRTSVRQFTADLRGARQRAITLNIRTAVSFTPGAAPASGGVRGRYAIYDEIIDTTVTPNTTTWTLVGVYKNLDQAVYFLDSAFLTNSALADDMEDIVFVPNGTITNLPTSPSTPVVVIKSDNKVPNNRCTLNFSASGSFTSALSTDS